MERDKIMKLIIISSGKYPNGGAAANRHLAYAKGLTELGHEIVFILLENQEWEGNYILRNEIKFICVYPSHSKPNSKIRKVDFLFKTIRNARRMISQESQTAGASALLVLNTDIVEVVPILKLARKLGLKVFHERTEYPFVVGGKTLIGKIKLSYYLRFLIKKFNGIFVINRALLGYFSSKTNGTVPIKIINMMVDPSRFECDHKKEDPNFLITYCGTLDGDKDGVPILLKSFAMIANEFPLSKLQLIGSLNNEATRNKIESLIRKFNLDKRVILPGAVDRNKIPELLCKSDILALARPNNKQAEGGFPTKLGEYLATGNAVVITKVGEIPLFLKDKKNAFISEPDSAEKFSEKLREALSNPDRSRIGLEGRKLVFNEFNYLTQARVMEEMILGE